MCISRSDGPKNIQTMQEWSQSKFDLLFDENESIDLLHGIIKDVTTPEHKQNGKVNLNKVKNDIRYR